MTVAYDEANNNKKKTVSLKFALYHFILFP